MKLPVYNQQGEKASEIEVPEIFEKFKKNDNLIHQAARWQILNSYHPWAHTKGRGEVAGGGRKPWRQKGTGRARHGSIRSPIWKGGGVTFGPSNEEVKAVKINKKMRRQAILLVIAQKLRDNWIRVLERLQPEKPKTKEIENILKHFLQPRAKKRQGNFQKYESALIVLPENDPATIRAIRNLPYADAIEARNLNILELLNHKYLFLEPKSLEVIIKTFHK